MKIALTIPGPNGAPMQIGSGVPVPTGGLFDATGNAGIGIVIIRTFVSLIVLISIFAALYFILIGGLNMITSRGHKESIKNNREAIIYAILGLFFVFLSFVIMQALGAFVGVDLFSFLIGNSSSISSSSGSSSSGSSSGSPSCGNSDGERCVTSGFGCDSGYFPSSHSCSNGVCCAPKYT